MNCFVTLEYSSGLFDLFGKFLVPMKLGKNCVILGKNMMILEKIVQFLAKLGKFTF